MTGNKKSILYILILFILSSIEGIAQNNERVFFDRYSGELGLSHIGVKTIIQDSKGFLWVGTYDGLNRYDGNKFRVFRHIPGDSTTLIHDRIHALIETHDKLLWIGTEEGLCIYDPTYETFYTPDFSQFQINMVRVLSLFEDSNQRIWVLSNNSNIYIIEKNRNSLRNISFQNNSSLTSQFLDIKEDENGYFFIASNNGLITIDPDLKVVPNNMNNNSGIRCIALDSDSVIWIGLQNGLLKARIEDMNNSNIRIEPIENYMQPNAVNNIIIDRYSNVWVGLLFNGLHKLIPSSSGNYDIISYYNDPEKLNTLSSDRISSIFEDRQGILWIGTSEKGLNKYNPSFHGFMKRNRLNSGKFGLNSDYILSFAEYNDYYFIGTRGRGISVMEKESGNFIKSPYNFSQLNELSVSSFMKDSRNILWIGTWQGLFRLLPGSNSLEKIGSNNSVIYDICEDDKGGIWLGTRNGLKHITINHISSDPEMISINLLGDNIDANLMIREVYNDPLDHSIWIGTWHNGLIHLRIGAEAKDPNDFEITHYLKDSEDEHALQSNFITTVLRNSRDDIWIGSEGGGLSHGTFDRDKLTFKNYNTADGISNNVVKIIMEDPAGHLWISTNNGLNRFSPDNEQFKIYEQNDGLASNYFTNAAIKAYNNSFLFGGNNGLTIFDPNRIVSDTIPPIPEIGSLQLSYHRVDPMKSFNGTLVLEKSISETNHLDLSFNQNTFSFELLALHFADPFKNRFKYRLHGFDQDWIYSRRGEYYANYANIKPGKYRFELYAANSDGLWSAEPKTIHIHIHPPFWKSGYAYAVYTILILLIIIYSLRIYRKIVTLQHKVEIEKIESQKQQELTEAKVKFFMNVSHEFKTPITLILGPLQWLAKHYSKDNLARSYLSIIKHQADYLMNLLEQLIYFRKAESAILELKCQYMDLVLFLQQIMGSYEWQANEQNINFRLDYSEPQIFIWFDPKKLEKVFHNLISNAFKYTKPGGRITLTLYHNPLENAVLVSVKDTGKGIAPEELEHIFERFYQVDSSAGGYGIGLSLTRSLVDLHKGSISVSSVKGKGSVFSVTLQTGSGHLTEEQKISNMQLPFAEFSPKEHEDVDQTINEKQTVSAKAKSFELILIVEDNLKMLAFLEKVFCNQYRVLTAKNGKEAMDLISINIPDLIISDLMMPEMDGLTFCRKIKQEILTCHIPFILLTAKGEIENRIVGLETGADQYINKPFDINLLTANVNSLILNRNRIKERINKNLPFDLTSEKVHPLDKELLERINEVVEANYENPDFDSNEFSRKVYMNRSQFFKKMKAVTGQTPSEYIRAYRMNRAVEFMIKEKVPVSEVNYKVGISSRSYFTKCFRELYGTSPSNFIKKRGTILS